MPDKWEYPWYAAWDLAFHCVAARARRPRLRQGAAAAAAARVVHAPERPAPGLRVGVRRRQPAGARLGGAGASTRSSRSARGTGDRAFLERVFHKLLLNFTWWVNRKDAEGSNVFQGGFLGLDNIGVFDRSAPLPDRRPPRAVRRHGWMAMYCLNMLAIALELARDDPAYEDVASKFFEHFLYIAHAMNNIGRRRHRALGRGGRLLLRRAAPARRRRSIPLKVRSMVGLIPLFAVETLEPELLDRLPGFKRRLRVVPRQPPGPRRDTSRCMRTPGSGERRLLVARRRRDRLRRVLRCMLDESEFLSPLRHPRAVARATASTRTCCTSDGSEHRVDYEPAESTHAACSAATRTGAARSGSRSTTCSSRRCRSSTTTTATTSRSSARPARARMLTLWEVADGAVAPADRASSCATTTAAARSSAASSGSRPTRTGATYVLFHEYFHGDNGAGLGASHQTGWTGLVAKLLQQSGLSPRRRRTGAPAPAAAATSR